MATVKVRTDGIVLDEMKYGESSKIIRLFTREKGVLSVMLKGAYKPKSPYVSLSQPFTEGRFLLRKGKTFYYISEGEILHMPLELRNSYEKLIAAALMAEVTLKSVREGEPNVKPYDLLAKAYRTLETACRPDLLVCGFLVKFISFIGFRPSLDQCISCGTTVTRPNRYDIRGGVLCDRCPSSTAVSMEDGRKTVYYFREILYTSLDKLFELTVDSATVEFISRVVLQSLQYHLEIRNFNTLNLLP